MQGVGVIRVRMDMGDKEVTKPDLVAKVVMEVLGRLLGDMMVMSWRCALGIKVFVNLLGGREEGLFEAFDFFEASKVTVSFKYFLGNPRWIASMSFSGFAPKWVTCLPIPGILLTLILEIIPFTVSGKIRFTSFGTSVREQCFFTQMLLELTQSSVQLLRENTDSVRSNQRISPTAPSEPLKLIGFECYVLSVDTLSCYRTSFSTVFY
ncbi:hypothetical protein Tco_0385121 [Tanacetum coccineum]